MILLKIITFFAYYNHLLDQFKIKLIGSLILEAKR
jgi:hypothetical protein